MATDDFFRARLDQMIDLRHPLAVLARRMPWGRPDRSGSGAGTGAQEPGWESDRRSRSVRPQDAIGWCRREHGRKTAAADAVDGVAAVPEACVQLE